MHKDVDVGYNYFVEHKLGVKHACHTITELLVIHTTKKLEKWYDVCSVTKLLGSASKVSTSKKEKLIIVSA
jgi:hypothetical protein